MTGSACAADRSRNAPWSTLGPARDDQPAPHGKDIMTLRNRHKALAIRSSQNDNTRQPD